MPSVKEYESHFNSLRASDSVPSPLEIAQDVVFKFREDGFEQEILLKQSDRLSQNLLSFLSPIESRIRRLKAEMKIKRQNVQNAKDILGENIQKQIAGNEDSIVRHQTYLNNFKRAVNEMESTGKELKQQEQCLRTRRREIKGFVEFVQSQNPSDSLHLTLADLPFDQEIVASFLSQANRAKKQEQTKIKKYLNYLTD